jgi:hypothetical protein
MLYILLIYPNCTMPLPCKKYYLLEIQDPLRTYYASFWSEHFTLPGTIRIIRRMKYPHKTLDHDVTYALIQLQKAVRKHIENRKGT